MSRSKKIVIVGAGVAGRSLASDLEVNGYEVVGFLDDNDSTSKHKVNKLGELKDVNQVIKAHQVTDVYFAIPSASSSVVREFINSIESDNVKVSIIPRSFSIIADEKVYIEDLKDVDILHLLGREPVKQDLLLAKQEIQNKKVLITGAAGSIGSELVKQVLLLDPKQVICVDFWESGMFYLRQEIEDRANLRFFIANIRDRSRLEKIFEETNPDFVFHAAAYKHVPLMQENSLEAYNNNVFGSLNLIETSIKFKVKSFVNVSTDKAVNPVNVMGTTKRIVELLLQKKSKEQTQTKISSVRFGNVLESNGSAVQLFKKQIANGGPLTLTHKDMTRFFMTKEEAAQLIIQSAILSNNGEIFVLDMGDPVKIYDLAKMMIKVSRKNTEIKEIGLRPGEKMYEELYYDKEDVIKTRHKQISIVNEKSNEELGKMTEAIEDLLEETIGYKLSNTELIDRLRILGFNIKK
ncbi:NAD-dependent epimerase/dehydratase family protein [Candidatus Dojkabacteria bacterium]|nr:NAD-dependent epimerase/dehydratase family protein [Candidatus Dojkabacteria bacterium]